MRVTQTRVMLTDKEYVDWGCPPTIGVHLNGYDLVLYPIGPYTVYSSASMRMPGWHVLVKISHLLRKGTLEPKRFNAFGLKALRCKGALVSFITNPTSA